MLCSGIYESEINENYIELLETLRKKEDFVKLHSSAQAASDTVSALNDMSACAASRIREFLLNQVYALQTPKTNIQIKQSVISKFKKLFGFLSERDCKSANEIRDAYKDIMGKVMYY